MFILAVGKRINGKNIFTKVMHDPNKLRGAAVK